MYWYKMTDAQPTSERTTIRRVPDRADYDPTSVRAILDEGLVAHVGFLAGSDPVVIPTAYARVDDVVYLHGSPASRMMKRLTKGVPVCVTVTLLDGLVLARSAFHHSMNYRSVVVMGNATEVRDAAEKARAFTAIVDQIVPGRSADARAANDFELKYTRLLAIRIDEASAKVRTGPPLDDAEDLALPTWAGVIPLRLTAGEPIADDAGEKPTAAPAYATRYRRPTPTAD